MEVGEVGRAQALDDVLLDAARRGDDCVDEFVLDEEEEDLAQARGDEVRREAEEDVAFHLRPRLGRLQVVWICGGDGVIREPPFALVGGKAR